MENRAKGERLQPFSKQVKFLLVEVELMGEIGVCSL